MRCSCGRRAVYRRRWEGRYYCASCLARQVEKSFKRGLREEGVPEAGRVAVAVSGGKDSMVLLHLSSKYLRHTHEIIPIIIDEGIAGYRPKALEIAADFARGLGLEPVVKGFREVAKDLDEMVKAGIREKPCTICGVFRRYLLNRAAKEVKADILLTGHNLDDFASSILLNFLKNDWGRFVRLWKHSEREGFVKRARPLKMVPEKEIVIYALANSIPYHDAECPYSHDNMRRDVLNMINLLEERYPGTKIQIVKSYQRIMESLKPADGKAGRCRICGEPASGDICRACDIRGRL